MNKDDQQVLLKQLDKYHKSIEEYCHLLNENLKKFEDLNLKLNQNLNENGNEKEEEDYKSSKN